MVMSTVTKPKKEPAWKRILREEGYDVRDSDEHPIDVRRRVLGLKDPDGNGTEEEPYNEL